jgi:uncharacterized protein
MIFIDTSAWLPLVDPDDRDHVAVRAQQERLASGEFGRAVTSNYVLTETMTLVRRRLGFNAALSLSRLIDQSKELRVVWVEPVHHREALALLFGHQDKEWSVVDCSSFVLMKALGITLALAIDKDFEQAGFERIP